MQGIPRADVRFAALVTTSHFAGVAWSLALPVMFQVYHSLRRYMHNVNAVERVLQPAANQVTA